MTHALTLTHADPGLRADGQRRYPVDTAEHCRMSWEAIHQSDDAGMYTGRQLADIRSRIRDAAARLGERYNDFHAPAGSSTGGQFSAGGASKSSVQKQKTAPKKATPHHSAAHASTSHGSLAFDGKRGPGYGMKNGDPAVHGVQDNLVRLGFAAKGDKNLGDGKYGPKTTAAVKRAQKALGLKADGIATPAFIAKLAATKTAPKPHRSAGLDLCVRSFGFEFEERAGGDGRTLEGYAAVFNSPTRIRDIGGDFDEVIHPGAFVRSLRSRTPILQWDHGKDPRVGTVPIGQIQDLAEDSRGLHVRARLYDNPVVEPVRQAIEGRSIKGMSFRFGVPDKGDEWSRRTGDVDLRGIRDADVHELGPVAFPAYDDTSVSVRSLLAQCDPDERRALIRELAEELRQYVDLTDLDGQDRAWSAPGVEDGDTSGSDGTPPPHLRQRLDDGALRTRGIL